MTGHAVEMMIVQMPRKLPTAEGELVYQSVLRLQPDITKHAKWHEGGAWSGIAGEEEGSASYL